MTRFRAQLLGGIVLLPIPIVTYAVCKMCWKTYLWSYGGEHAFVELVIKEPLLEQWTSENPRQILMRSAPLSTVPRHIVFENEGDVESGHKHHENY